MIGLEVVAAGVLAVLVASATWMAVVGLMGAVGGVRLKRCRSCGHLRAAWSLRPGCPYCRHPWLVAHLLPMRLHHFLTEEMEPALAPAPSDREVE